MVKDLISIQDTADLTGKSIQTIRRAIKAKKIKFKKERTPQGFNYLLDKYSVCEFYGIQEQNGSARNIAKETLIPENKPDTMSIEFDDFKSFVQTLKTMIAQHSEERQNFLRLVNTMQEKIFVLENQVNLLKAPQKRWFNFWK